MLEKLQQYYSTAKTLLQNTANLADLESFYREHLAPSGKATNWKREIGKVPVEERRAFGQAVNEVTSELLAAFETRRDLLKLKDIAETIAAQATDVTLPGRPLRVGGFHPSTLAVREVSGVFQRMGFMPFESAHVELDRNNFEYLNMPPDHPARDMQDTFYFSEDILLRTHTSSGQIHAMRRFAPEPLRIVLPGLCYRHENITPRSEIQFHQVEGLLIGPNVRMSDLKGVLLQFARQMFGPNQQIRVRGSYFPFTEPSVEVDIRCTLCSGEGCRVCKHTGWLELLGAGMVHPAVLRFGGYDPEKVRGIAFGLGIERLILLRHGIDDIRYIFQNDLRFLRQFGE
ncbi:MAG: phenylalanine--tRNA ligase subunit alpha [Myxococcales bacterium]|nr:phenylalanine--tRNA ligase subunit alpha [Myxococcales bacterium]